MITHYAEREDKDGWYAEQEEDKRRYRESADRYPSRLDLVGAIAFGKHVWTRWEGIDKSTEEQPKKRVRVRLND